ncbi:MAG: hypothetical protein ACI9OI_001731, partial [Chitinophagales bacterium]
RPVLWFISKATLLIVNIILSVARASVWFLNLKRELRVLLLIESQVNF